jgi:hypothetical protein
MTDTNTKGYEAANNVSPQYGLAYAIGAFARAAYETSSVNADSNAARSDTGAVGITGQSVPNQTQMAMRAARNSISTELITVSNTLCGEYEQSLKEKSSNITFGLGSLALAFGGAGAIFANSTASVFSALSGVASGVSSEYNKDFFQGLATSIIIPGIEKQRTALAQTMAKNMCFGITTYPLPMAIADVIRYHNACSMDKGIAATSQSVNKSLSDPDTLKSTIQEIEDLHKLIAGAKPAGTPTSDETTDDNRKKPRRKTPQTTDAPPSTKSGGSDAGSSDASAQAPGKTGAPPLGTDVTLTDCPSLDQYGKEINESTTKPGTAGEQDKNPPGPISRAAPH